MFLDKTNKIKWGRMVLGAMITVALVVCGILWFDIPIHDFLRQFDCKLWTIIGYIFSAEVWIIASGVLLLMFYVKKSVQSKPKFRNAKHKISIKTFALDAVEKTQTSYAFYIFYSVLCASVVAQILKIVIGRTRPILFEYLDMYDFYPFIKEWAFNSMPSGHTVATFAGLVMFGLLAPRWRWLTWGLAIVVGVSRICVGAHWPSDVILGAFIGMAMADLVKAFVKKTNSI